MSSVLKNYPGQFVCCNPVAPSRQAHRSAWCRRLTVLYLPGNVKRRKNQTATTVLRSHVICVCTLYAPFKSHSHLPVKRKAGYQLDSGEGLDDSLAMTYACYTVCSRGGSVLRNTSRVYYPG